MKTKDELMQILIDLKQELDSDRPKLVGYYAGVKVGKHIVYKDLLTSNYSITEAEYKQINLHV